MNAVISYRQAEQLLATPSYRRSDKLTARRFALLETIDAPSDLRKFPESSLEAVALELRQYLIQSVAKSGGHFASGLGATELTLALHYVFNTPEDRLVWDIGHQCYPHKIITGRRTLLHTIREKGGLSGFPKRIESRFDTFGVAHAGTSISGALGMAIAAKQSGDDRKVVSVIGDGAMTAGMAFEALDHAGDLNADILVVLNDNNMSISPNVGALSNHLTQLLNGWSFPTNHDKGWNSLRLLPQVKAIAKRAEQRVKKMLTPATLFAALGFEYYGPVDGHDLQAMVSVLRKLSGRKGPRLLHVVTRKGNGYEPAEEDPVAYHAVTPFASGVGMIPAKKATSPSYTQVFGNWICDMAEKDQRLVGITPAMREGSGLVEFCKRFPERYFDVGIAEQHAVTLAAGIACDGMKPVVAIYSTFLQRAYDQFIHDVAIQNLPVLFAIDRAGLVGPDGATHAGSFDLSFLRCIPNLIVMAPADEDECRKMLYTGFLQDQPTAVRYPRGRGPGMPVEPEMKALPIGKGKVCRHGKKTAILAFGAMVSNAMEAAERLDASVVNMRFVKPLDESLIAEMAASHQLLVTVEDNVVAGGAGSAVNEYLAASQLQTPIINVGLPDEFLDHGPREELLADCGLSAEGLVREVENHYLNLSIGFKRIRT